MTGSVTYNSVYKWDRGAQVEDVNLGNTISNQSSWNADGRINFESLYKKIPYLKDVEKRFNSTRQNKSNRKAKKFERTYKLQEDTSLVIKHNLRTKKVKVTAKTTKNQAFTVKTRVIDANSIEVLTRGDQNIKFTVLEVIGDDRSTWRDIADHTTRFLLMVRSASVKYRTSQSLSLRLFSPEIGNVFGQSNSYGPMSPGLDFAFGFTDESYIERALERGWLITDNGQTSPAIWSKTQEINAELNLEPVKGLKIQLTTNRTDNRTNQIQFMYDDMPTSRSGSFTMTHCAIATSLRSGGNADNGYYNEAFNTFLSNIPVVAQRYEQKYYGLNYPTTGFMRNNIHAGNPFDPKVGTVSQTSSDVLIPAFVAAYTGKNASSIYLNPFPSFANVLPNWRVTYDGLLRLGNLKNIFKTFKLTHAYQCTYTVGSYSSYLNWIGADGEFGFTLDELTGTPIPSSPYNISSVAITEKFAPLIGVNATLKNDLQFNAEFRDSRTLTLNSSAGQVVEATIKAITVGAGYKIIGFNSVLKMKKSTGISNDLTLNADFSYQQSQALIRNIENNYTQATNGTRSISINFTANYVMSKRLTIGAYFDHQINTPLESSASYPTTNSSYGISLNLSLAR